MKNVDIQISVQKLKEWIWPVLIEPFISVYLCGCFRTSVVFLLVSMLHNSGDLSLYPVPIFTQEVRGGLPKKEP